MSTKGPNHRYKQDGGETREFSELLAKLNEYKIPYACVSPRTRAERRQIIADMQEIMSEVSVAEGVMATSSSTSEDEEIEDSFEEISVQKTALGLEQEPHDIGEEPDDPEIYLIKHHPRGKK